MSFLVVCSNLFDWNFLFFFLKDWLYIYKLFVYLYLFTFFIIYGQQKCTTICKASMYNNKQDWCLFKDVAKRLNWIVKFDHHNLKCSRRLCRNNQLLTSYVDGWYRTFLFDDRWWEKKKNCCNIWNIFQNVIILSSGRCV